MPCDERIIDEARPVRAGWFTPVTHDPRARPATHDHAVLTFHTAGASTVELRGRWTVTAGDVLLVPAGEPHRMIEATGAEVWGLGFCATCFAIEERDDLLAPLARVRSGGAAVVRMPEARRAFLASLFAELGRETARPGGGSFVVQRSLVTLVLAEVSRAASAHADDVGPGVAGADVVAEALRFIEIRCLDPISLRDVAAAVRRSPAHLTTLVRKATGRSVGAWITAGRLAEARRHLLHGDEHVDVVAERVGYQDPTHFIRTFRRAHGLTPAAWRAQQRSG